VLCSCKSEYQEIDLIDTCTFGKVRRWPRGAAARLPEAGAGETQPGEMPLVADAAAGWQDAEHGVRRVGLS
jgi:hypothetical protein